MLDVYFLAAGFFVLFATHATFVHLQLRDFRAALRGLDEEQGKLEQRYAAILSESIVRQRGHEEDYTHKGGQTTSLRIETIARRFEKKIRAAGLPAMDRQEARRRVKEALCQLPG